MQEQSRTLTFQAGSFSHCAMAPANVCEVRICLCLCFFKLNQLRDSIILGEILFILLQNILQSSYRLRYQHRSENVVEKN